MASDDHITRYDVMPIPPIEEHTEYFDAGALRFATDRGWEAAPERSDSMPKYMLIVVEDVDREWASPAAAAEMMGRMGRFAGELGQRGKIAGGGPLTGIDQAARLRQVDGQLAVTDGPFAETKEMIAGYFILDADDRADGQGGRIVARGRAAFDYADEALRRNVRVGDKITARIDIDESRVIDDLARLDDEGLGGGAPLRLDRYGGICCKCGHG